jgi:hypothetical protein
MIFAMAVVLQATSPALNASAVSEITQASLDRMSDRCRAPRDWLKHLDGNRVRFQPSLTAKFDKVDCVLGQLKKSDLPMNLGFVGNEAASNSEKK